METEKKYLIPDVPNTAMIPDPIKIEQHYLAVTEDREVRIRRTNEPKYTQEVKIGKGQDRRDPGTEITRAQYEDLKKGSMGSVRKARREIPWHTYKIELDIYEGDLEGLVVAEIEFDDEVPENFLPPVWFGEEITEDERYKNKWLATQGEPTL